MVNESLLGHAIKWSEEKPDDIYLVQPLISGGTQSFTWHDVLIQARCLASWMICNGFTDKSHIGILGKNTAHWIIADLAIWMAGNISVPMYPTLNAKTARYVVDHAQVKLLFVGKMNDLEPEWNEIKKALPGDVVVVGLPESPSGIDCSFNDIINSHESLSLDRFYQPCGSDVATIIYTSGSTGNPKGVVISHDAMVTACKGFEKVIGFSDKDRMLSYLPLAHAAERAAVESTSLYFGFTVFFAQSLDTFVEDIKRASPTIFFSVPRLWAKFHIEVNKKMSSPLKSFLMSAPVISTILKRKILEGLGLDKVRVALTGSAPLPEHVIDWFRGVGLDLLEVYGMSENFGYSHANKPGKNRLGYVGFSNPGVECQIDPRTSEVLVKSPASMQGYYNDEEKTAESFDVNGYLKTGDIGELDADGCLKITGRVKELFKTSKGKYVSPAPIENLVSQSEVVELSCVMGSGCPQPFVVVMLTEDALVAANGADGKQKISKCLVGHFETVNNALEPHERLSCVMVSNKSWTIENGMLTPTMKIKRSEIEKYHMPMVSNAGKGQVLVWL